MTLEYAVSALGVANPACPPQSAWNAPAAGIFPPHLASRAVPLDLSRMGQSALLVNLPV